MTRLVQFWDAEGRRRVGVPDEHGAALRLVEGDATVVDLALTAIRDGRTLAELVADRLGAEQADYERIVQERRLLPPLDHPDPARCTVSLTGLTHLGSAASRDAMHQAVASGTATDSMRMFQIGVEGGKPAEGGIGAQPEWAYKGDGRAVVAPEQPLPQPAFALDGGEEAEIAGLYVIDDAGNPWRVGFAIGNEFSDHVLERQNYLYLAHSKLRPCSLGPELLLGALPDAVSGTIRIRRGGDVVWSSPFETGEANMAHAIANLEHHHFKYALFRRPGDVHIHYFGANGVSFGAGFQVQDGDLFEVEVPLFGRPLRNPVAIERGDRPIRVRPL